MYLGKWTAVVLATCATAFGIAGAASAQVPVRGLTLDEAVKLALEQNLDLRVERVNLLIQDENVGIARAAFVPTFLSNAGYNNTTTPPDSFLSGT